MTTQADAAKSTRPILASYLLVAAGAALALSGGIWWAWDASPNVGKVLLLGACAVFGASYWTARSPRRLPSWSLVGAAVFILLAAGYAIWAAIGTIVYQSTVYVG